mmetsp:Transcript_104715/g.303064  ORF Transcript_104715/g.303064 Transcript_104715/m.303064 type:complete len:286 (-) Transcript_104715:306-1163(-)
MHRVVQAPGVSLLEVRSTASANQQRIPCEDSARRSRQQPAHAPISVAGSGQAFDREAAEGHLRSGLHLHVRLGAGGLGNHRAHLGQLLPDEAARGDVVCMRVRVHYIAQGQTELTQDSQVSFLLLEHRVDEQRLLRLLAAEEVREGPRLGVEELGEDEALGRLQNRAGVRRGQLREQPIPRRPAPGALHPELQVHVLCELPCRLGAVAVLLRQPEQQQGAGAIPSRALQHERPRQCVHGLQSRGDLRIRRQGVRPRERPHLQALHRLLQHRLEELLAVGLVHVHP